jgi:hypothetical protein
MEMHGATVKETHTQHFGQQPPKDSSRREKMFRQLKSRAETVLKLRFSESDRCHFYCSDKSEVERMN